MVERLTAAQLAAYAELMASKQPLSAYALIAQLEKRQYLLCSECGKVDELQEKKLGSLLDKVADQHGFRPAKAIVEVSGLCGNCVAADHPQ